MEIGWCPKCQDNIIFHLTETHRKSIIITKAYCSRCGIMAYSNIIDRSTGEKKEYKNGR